MRSVPRVPRNFPGRRLPVVDEDASGWGFLTWTIRAQMKDVAAALCMVLRRHTNIIINVMNVGECGPTRNESNNCIMEIEI